GVHVEFTEASASLPVVVAPSALTPFVGCTADPHPAPAPSKGSSMQSTLKRGLAIAAGLTLAFGLSACAADAADSSTDGSNTGGNAEGTFASGNSDTLVFAVLPDHEGADQDAQPIADWIAEVTGKNVEF